jgi:hypothetical protein
MMSVLPLAVLGLMRAVVLTVGEEDPSVLEGVRALGADTVVTYARPSAAAASLATAHGLRYIPFLSVSDADRLLVDGDFLQAMRAIPVAGFHYDAEDAVEGYTTAEDQRRAYGILKTVFPDAIVLYATRLDPVATDPAFLDAYFRPEYTDLVAPYFYPVGTTILGTYGEDDAWEERLASLLAPVAARMPAGQGVLPVLQAFQQDGYPVGADFPTRQLDAYRRIWPGLSDIAAFWWGDAGGGPLFGLSSTPVLARAFTRLLYGLTPEPTLRLVGPRVPAPAR